MADGVASGPLGKVEPTSPRTEFPTCPFRPPAIESLAWILSGEKMSHWPLEDSLHMAPNL